jgi:hypothetical protein
MDLITLLVYLFFFCIIGGVAYYIVTLLPLPEPFKNIAVICVLLILLLILISMFLGGGGYLHFPLHR